MENEKKEIDDELIEEFEEAQKEYNETVFENSSNKNEEEKKEQEAKEEKKEEKLNKKKPDKETKWIFILGGILCILVISIVLLLVNNNEKLLIGEKDYNETLEKLEKQEEKINNMTDIEKDFAGIKVEKENEIEKTKEEEIKKEHQTDSYKHYDSLTEEEKKEQEVIPREEIIPIEELDKIKKEEEIDDNIELPAKFNLTDKIKIEVEDQAAFGLCWDFASTTSLQTHYALKTGKNINLSKIHVDYLTSNKIYGYRRTIHDGGNFDTYETYLTITNPVETKVLEYKDYSDIKEIDYFLDQPTTDFRVEETVNFPNVYKYGISEEEYQEQRNDLINAVKHHIMKNGSVYAGIYAPDSGQPYFDATNYALYYNGDYSKLENARGMHAISIVGWDDSYSKDNFNSETRPNNDGAFIALNSWGENWGNKGYFYISYEDETVLDDANGILSISLDDAIPLDSIKSKLVKQILDEKLSYSYFEVNGKTYVSKLALKRISYLELKNMNLTDKDVKDLTIFESLFNLDISNNKITDISFIKDMKKLSSINIENNEIEDLSSIKDLNLYQIEAAGNKIKDVSYLVDSPKLYFLNISNNKGVTGFDKLTNLQVLYISNVDTDLSGINNLNKLQSLDLSKNDLTTLPKELNNLTTILDINLSNCNIKSINDLPALPEVNAVLLNNNKIEDLTNIDNKFPKVLSIDLSNNKEINDYTPLETIGQNEELDYGAYGRMSIDINLSNNNISEISKINSLNAPYINLSNNNISSLKDYNNEKIISLDLSDNKINNLKNFDPKNIEIINLTNNNIEDLDGFDTKKIYSLILSNNKNIKNLSSLKDSNISYLNLNDNNIKDLSEIKNLTKLKGISLDNNQIEDISDIKDMPNLMQLSLINNNIKKATINKNELITINLENNKLEDLTIENCKNLYYIDVSDNKEINAFWENIDKEIEYLSIIGNDITLNENHISKISNMKENNIWLSNFTIIHKEKGLSSNININNTSLRRSLLKNITNLYMKNGKIDSKARTLEVIDTTKDIELNPNIYQIDDIHQITQPTIIIK